MKDKVGVKWFDEYSHNTIILSREPNEYVFYDVEKDSEDIANWINKMSLDKHADPLNRETDVISKLLGESKAIMYINTKDKKHAADSKVALNALKRVAPYFSQDKHLSFFYVDFDSEYTRVKDQYGIKWNESPAFTIVTPKGNYFPLA